MQRWVDIRKETTNMTKAEKMRWRRLCEVLAKDPTPARRARAATALQTTIAQEKKKASTAEDASLLRVAEKVFRFLEQGPWQEPSPSVQNADSDSHAGNTRCLTLAGD
jgi:hypothetical protein